MSNYGLKYKVSEISEILKVDKQLIKDWTFHFAEYLNPKANPEKGIEREFDINDICTFNYISNYWEENPDFENIKYGLNEGAQFENPCNQLAIETTPIFREYSEEFVGRKVWIIGGMNTTSNLLSLANSYKKCGDALINMGIEDEQNRKLIYPAIYNYRHSTELYLKSVLPEYEEIHELDKLYSDFKDFLKNNYTVVPPTWFENIITTFNEFDPNGTSFRYGDKFYNEEFFIDLAQIKKLMNWLSESIHNIKERGTERERPITNNGYSK